MPDIKVYKTQDLVLQVKQNYNPAKLNRDAERGIKKEQDQTAIFLTLFKSE